MITTPIPITATAYCEYGRTASGRLTHHGTIAADPHLLPLGTIVRLRFSGSLGSLTPKARTIAQAFARERFSVDDTGSAIVGRRIDIWIPDLATAVAWGRQHLTLEVLSDASASRSDHNNAKEMSMTRRTVSGLEPGSYITVRIPGRHRRSGRVVQPAYTSAKGHVRVEYRDDNTGALCYARIEDVRIDRALEQRRKRRLHDCTATTNDETDEPRA